MMRAIGVACQVVRKPLSVRVDSRRTLDQRLALRLPRLASLGNRLLVRLPPKSRLRQALVWRAVRLGYEAFNRRDFEAVLINFHHDFQFFPPRRTVAGGILESSYRGHDGFRTAFGEWLTAWGAYRVEPRELIDLGDRLLMLGELRGHGHASGVPLSQSYASLLTLGNESVISQRDYLDRADALEAAELLEQRGRTDEYAAGDCSLPGAGTAIRSGATTPAWDE
jgi:ketosteroid isomerase-like protein